MSPRDPDATKARIFEAATAEFAAYGIAGARVDRIARNAKANKQLIYAYFGDKETLFHQVLEHAMIELANAVTDNIEDLDTWIDQHIAYHHAHPEMLRLLLWEALELGSERATAGELRASRYASKRHWIAVAQDKGLIRSDMPAGQILMTLMSLINYQFAVPQVRGYILGPDADPEESRAWTRDAIRRILAPMPDSGT
ncbi:TetR family transcriptional regulator [Nocardia huaxiensis]|uniref:TetR/AcrR family transcriptional regulator n=1 Tax=Nocardia huaxiensis TaxID=2755382 RepID=A0A7D6VGF0_9NOCA|nr:TetR family transcriptional regulator [Nocardia huaxiensis]QLY32075.1 TetR/AcrR family transcriptional regulator [Nocardia huaxiensis]UFS95654.1 TetR family transcriptional regulator [Nocardia huaxiensis]